MLLSDLDYGLPQDLIAQSPADTRDAARLLVLSREDGSLRHCMVRDLPTLLRPHDCVVVNQTRVIPAKFTARRPTGGSVSGLFLHESSAGHWDVLLNGRGRLKVNDELHLGGDRWLMQLQDQLPRGAWYVRVAPRDPAATVLTEIGRMPLPPYIRRSDDDADGADRERYQTIFAADPGAVAAPTAGLHFTPAIVDGVLACGATIAALTLHVGRGTFTPVEVDDLRDHRMHAEWYRLTPEAADTINAARAAGGRIIAIGTTSVRVLESLATDDRTVQAGEGWTNILIQPPYAFRMVDALMTNFHLPRTTLLALVCAFAGRDLVLSAYQAAIAERYRFYSYGDAMLIL